MGFFGKSLKKQLIDLASSKLKEGDQKDFDTYLNEIPESSSLDKENQDIIEWLLSNSRIKEDKLEVLKSADLGGRTISFHDENNQKLRRMLSDEVEFLESGGDRVKVLSAYELLRSMHQRRKVSDLVGLLQQSAD